MLCHLITQIVATSLKFLNHQSSLTNIFGVHDIILHMVSGKVEFTISFK